MHKILNFLLPVSLAACLFSCSSSRMIDRKARSLVIEKQELRSAHVGISLYDESSNKYIYNYQGDKYFVPASNTKLFSLYAGLTFLGDSLPGIRFHETPDTIYLEPTGDPSFLHPDFTKQPVLDWLKKTSKALVISDGNWQDKEFGYGWSWDDFNSGYMPERSPLPAYGNVLKWSQVIEKTEGSDGKMKEDISVFSEPEVSWKVRFNPAIGNRFSVIRERNDNLYYITEGKEILRTIEVPFVTNGMLSALDLIRENNELSITFIPADKDRQYEKMIYSQPTDTLFSIMMHRSDNLFAEQVMMMVSNKVLHEMNVERLIDTLLKKELKDIPQPPKWVDGSGLSRYNQFTPQDFIWLLKKMDNSFPRSRLEAILPGANEGTLSGYFKELAGSIHAKTGSLTGQTALSGYLTTKKNKRLLFSVMVNNHNASTTMVRRSVEAFLKEVYLKY